MVVVGLLGGCSSSGNSADGADGGDGGLGDATASEAGLGDGGLEGGTGPRTTGRAPLRHTPALPTDVACGQDGYCPAADTCATVATPPQSACCPAGTVAKTVASGTGSTLVCQYPQPTMKPPTCPTGYTVACSAGAAGEVCCQDGSVCISGGHCCPPGSIGVDSSYRCILPKVTCGTGTTSCLADGGTAGKACCDPSLGQYCDTVLETDGGTGPSGCQTSALGYVMPSFPPGCAVCSGQKTCCSGTVAVCSIDADSGAPRCLPGQVPPMPSTAGACPSTAPTDCGGSASGQEKGCCFADTQCCSAGQCCPNLTTCCGDGKTCCPTGSTCSGTSQCLCPDGQPPCGTACCSAGLTCTYGKCHR